MAAVSQAGLLMIHRKNGLPMDRRKQIDFRDKSNWQTSLTAACMIEGVTSLGIRFTGSGKAFKNEDPNVFYFLTTAHNLVEFDKL